jgi:hypothetical protein
MWITCDRRDKDWMLNVRRSDSATCLMILTVAFREGGGLSCHGLTSAPPVTTN